MLAPVSPSLPCHVCSSSCHRPCLMLLIFPLRSRLLYRVPSRPSPAFAHVTTMLERSRIQLHHQTSGELWLPITQASSFMKCTQDTYIRVIGRILLVHSCVMSSLTWQFGLILLVTMSLSPWSNHLHLLIVALSLPPLLHCSGVSHTPYTMHDTISHGSHPHHNFYMVLTSATAPHLRGWPIRHHESCSHI